MARTTTAEAQQLALFDLSKLDKQLDEQRGRPVKLPVRPDDIGGELLSLLSKGLYTNPLDCIREYVQNGVDAQSRDITIKITGNSVMIFDDGNGMDLKDMLRARQFGLSPKSMTEHVGFRGIGIYSGFDLCRSLRITSTKAGDPHAHVLVFDFAAMRARLDDDKRLDASEPKTSLIDLLSEYTEVMRESVGYGEEAHFTIVELQDISDVHIRVLANRDDLKRYLLQNMPIAFADTFPYKDVLSEQLQDNVPGYHAVRITLQTDGEDDVVVAKYGDVDVKLQAPTHGYITTDKGRQVAFYWACLTDEREHVDKNVPAAERPRHAGFVYKVKGFTIGDRQKLMPMFKKKTQLYRWYTGEVYVIDTNVIPNAERNDFETNQAKTALEMSVGKKLVDLEKAAEQMQARSVADERVATYQEEVAKIERQVLENSQASGFETYYRLGVILDDLERQRSKAGDANKRAAVDLIKRADRLQKQLSQEADEPPTEATKRKRAARNTQLPIRPAVPTVAPPPPAPPKTLLGVLKDSGWEIEGEVARLVDIIQGSLEDVLAPGSASYRSLLSDIEARLAAGTVDE